MSAREVGLALDLRHDRRPAVRLDLFDDARPELGADDAPVEELAARFELAARVEEGEARRRAAPAGRAVDLAVGEDGDVPLSERAA